MREGFVLKQLGIYGKYKNRLSIGAASIQHNLLCK